MSIVRWRENPWRFWNMGRNDLVYGKDQDIQKMTVKMQPPLQRELPMCGKWTFVENMERWVVTISRHWAEVCNAEWSVSHKTKLSDCLCCCHEFLKKAWWQVVHYRMWLYAHARPVWILYSGSLCGIPHIVHAILFQFYQCRFPHILDMSMHITNFSCHTWNGTEVQKAP